MPITWSGVLLVEGVETGDGRLIREGATTWRDLPLTLRAVFEDGAGGHEGATPVGTIQNIERRDDGVIWGEGSVLAHDDAATRWANQNRQGAMRGVSVDLTGGEAVEELVDNATGEVIDLESLAEDDLEELLWGEGAATVHWRVAWSAAELGAATSVGTPAFSQAVIDVAGELDATTEFAAAGSVSVGDRVRWTDDDGDQTGTVSAVSDDGGTVTVGGTDLPVGDVTVITDDDESDDEPVAAAVHRPALRALLARESGGPVTASGAPTRGAVVVSSVAWDEGPPAAFFDRLDLAGPTPFTITDDGEVYGHIATWGSCHVGFATGRAEDCVRPTRSPSNYALFHASGQIRTAEGTRVSVGPITMHTGHAPTGVPGNRPPLRTVTAHYDNTGLQAAHVVARDDDYGIQVHGALAAGVSVADVRTAMAGAPSGDWRAATSDGLDLVGILMVNVPGFPTYAVDSEEPVLLTASLAPTQAAIDRAALTAGCGGSCGSCSCEAKGERPNREPAPVADEDVAVAGPLPYAALRESTQAKLAGYDRSMRR